MTIYAFRITDAHGDHEEVGGVDLSQRVTVVGLRDRDGGSSRFQGELDELNDWAFLIGARVERWSIAANLDAGIAWITKGGDAPKS